MKIPSRKLHPSYAAAWGVHAAWLVGMLVVPPAIWVVWLHQAAFVVLEGIAVVKRKRPGDTLSEFMQAVAGKAGLRSRWFQSWKGLTSLFAGMYAAEAGYVVAYAWGWWVGAPIATGVFFFLLYHWVRTEKHG